MTKNMKTKKIKVGSITIQPDSKKVEIVDLPEFADAYSYYIGDGMVMLRNGRFEIFVVNTEAGLIRQFVDSNERLLVDASEVNEMQILSHLSNGRNFLLNRIATFGGLHTWDGFKNGFCALDWTVYPDGRYFADEGGFGMEDNDEEVAYCVIDKNLKIVVPFFYADDPKEVLASIRNGTYEPEPFIPVQKSKVVVDVVPVPTRWELLITTIKKTFHFIF